MPEQNLSISSFKKFFLRMLLPLMLSVSAAGIVVSYLFEKTVILNSNMVGAYKVNRIITENHPAEIPIFGSSRAEGSFIPDSLGANYFNYGLSGTKYDVTLFFLEEECKKKKSTPWIILNLDLDGLGYGIGDIGNYIPNANYGPVKKILGTNYHTYFSIPFIKYYGRYESYFRDYLNNSMQLTKISDKGASLEKKILTDRQFAELVGQRAATTTTFTADSLLLFRLKSMISLHQNRFFIFVVSPYHSSYFAQYSNPDEATAFLHNLGAAKNVKVLDFSKMPFPDSLFFNTSHLNYKGAAIFCHQLKDSLAAMGVY